MHYEIAQYSHTVNQLLHLLSSNMASHALEALSLKSL